MKDARKHKLYFVLSTSHAVQQGRLSPLDLSRGRCLCRALGGGLRPWPPQEHSWLTSTTSPERAQPSPLISEAQASPTGRCTLRFFMGKSCCKLISPSPAPVDFLLFPISSLALSLLLNSQSVPFADLLFPPFRFWITRDQLKDSTNLTQNAHLSPGRLPGTSHLRIRTKRHRRPSKMRRTSSSNPTSVRQVKLTLPQQKCLEPFANEDGIAGCNAFDIGCICSSGGFLSNIGWHVSLFLTHGVPRCGMG